MTGRRQTVNRRLKDSILGASHWFTAGIKNYWPLIILWMLTLTLGLP